MDYTNRAGRGITSYREDNDQGYTLVYNKVINISRWSSRMTYNKFVNAVCEFNEESLVKLVSAINRRNTNSQVGRFYFDVIANEMEFKKISTICRNDILRMRDGDGLDMDDIVAYGYPLRKNDPERDTIPNGCIVIRMTVGMHNLNEEDLFNIHECRNSNTIRYGITRKKNRDLVKKAKKN